jgi:hypothetical protein
MFLSQSQTVEDADLSLSSQDAQPSPQLRQVGGFIFSNSCVGKATLSACKVLNGPIHFCASLTTARVHAGPCAAWFQLCDRQEGVR